MSLISKVQKNYGIILLILIGIFLRFYQLGFQSAWLDEVLVLKESDPNSPFNVMYSAVKLRDSTSFLHIFSIHYLGQIWEHNIVLARYISAIAGSLSIYYIYRLGILMLNKRVGYIAAVLLTLNLFHIEYSQEARSYALLVLFVIIAFYRFYHYVYRPSVSNAIYLGVFMGLVTNAHPIGLLNVASLFIILFILFIFKKNWKSRNILIKEGIISASVTLIIFSIIFPIVLAASKITSFWIAEASFERVQQVFTELAGRSDILLWLTIIAFIYFTIRVIVEIKRNKTPVFENKIVISYLVLLIWLGLEIGVILIKSFVGISILLSRYMIAIVPAMVLVLAFGIELIKNKIVKYSILFMIIGFSFYNMVYKIDYYNSVSKANFKETADYINKRNHRNDKVVSRYGYVVSYYVNKGNPATVVLESELDDYITSIKNQSIPEESFWYFDGNSARFSLSQDNLNYLNENFKLKENLEMYDCWTKHYVLRKEPKEDINFKDGLMQLSFKNFNSSHKDATGNILMFENSIVKSNSFSIPKGIYTLILNGNSLPKIPIEGENARLKIRINDKIIGNFYLSEDKNNSKNEFKFKNNSNEAIAISVEFYNDVSKGNLDRNVILYSLSIRK